MNRRQATIWMISLVLACGLGAWAGYRYAGRGVQAPVATRSTAVSGARRILYWYDPMVPDQHFAKPGKSPFMDMPLQPKYADMAGAPHAVHIDPAMSESLAVRETTVRRGMLRQRVDAPAIIAWDDRMQAVVQLRTAAFVERVYGRSVGDRVGRGAPLAQVLVPDWAGAQQEYLAARATGDAELAAAARERLMLLGMNAAQIAQVDRSGQVQARITLTAPLAGVLQEVNVRTGMALSAGATVARINAVDPVWVEAEVPEAQASQVRVGQVMQVRLASAPGTVRQGKVIEVLPEVAADTRSVRVRVQLPNADEALRPGMYATIRLKNPMGPAGVLVPAEAVIHTGTRDVVILSLHGGQRFVPVEVKTGGQGGDEVLVLSGLQPGQRIVRSGEFLIDSEASLTGVLARMNSAGAPHVMPAMVTPPATHAVTTRAMPPGMAMPAGGAQP